MRSIWLEWQITELIDDQQFGLGIEAQPLLEAALGMGLDQSRYQGWGRDEQNRVALADRRTAERKQHASSRIWRRSSEGWAAKSKPSRSRAYGKWAIFIAISIRRSSLRAISRSHSNASASRRLSSRRLASSSRLSS